MQELKHVIAEMWANRSGMTFSLPLECFAHLENAMFSATQRDISRTFKRFKKKKKRNS